MYKGNNLKTLTLNTLNTFSEDEQLQQCFVSVDDAIADDREEREEVEKINVSTGAEKGEGNKIDSINISSELPFLSGKDSPVLQHILSPHADTLEIDDLDDIESVKSELSN